MLIPVYRESSSARNCVNHGKPLLITKWGLIYLHCCEKIWLKVVSDAEDFGALKGIWCLRKFCDAKCFTWWFHWCRSLGTRFTAQQCTFSYKIFLLEMIFRGISVTNSYKISSERESPLLLITSGKQTKKKGDIKHVCWSQFTGGNMVFKKILWCQMFYMVVSLMQITRH
jgi:hypothetical protein